MDITAAKIILANLRERIEIGGDGKYRLPGIVTQKELDALEFVISGQLDAPTPVSTQSVVVPRTEEAESPTLAVPAALEPESVDESDEAVTLDLSTLSLSESDSAYRVCMDFGTAMSKATFVHDGEDDEMEEIRVLKLGVPGDQEQIDDVMLEGVRNFV